MKRLLLLVMLLFLNVALLNATNIYATTENSQTPDNNQNLSLVQENLTGTLNNENIQNSAGNAVKTAVLANDTSKSNLSSSNDSSNTSANQSSNYSSDLTNVQNSNDAAGENIYNNVHGIWLKAEDVGILNVDEIKSAGITDIFFKMNLLTDPNYQTVLPALLNKLNGTNIRVHAWISCFKDSNNQWIDPANQTQRMFLLDNIKTIVENYRIDGIHLDYVRYSGVGNDAAYNYLNATDTITSFVKDVYNMVKSINPKVAVSAALMPECSLNPYYYGQNYTQLAPYLDFLVPMIYKGNYGEDTAWIGSTTKWIVDNSCGKPVIAGIQTYGSDNNITEISASELNADIKSAIDNGSSGYVLFRYGLIDSNFFKNSGSSTSFSNDQLTDAAVNVKNSIDINHQLPSTVNIGGQQVDMYSFLYMLSYAVQNIYNHNPNGVVVTQSFNGPEAQNENIQVGNMGLSEIIHIADEVKVYMDKTGYTPGYAYGTSLGTNFGWQSMIYTFSSILTIYNETGSLPSSVTVKPWKILSDTNAATFTNQEVIDAAASVKNSIDNTHQLPSTVSIGGKQVDMYSFLYLLSYVVQNVYNNNPNPVNSRNFNGPEAQNENIQVGNMGLSEIIHIADVVKVYMDKTGYVPGYAYGTSLGNYFGWQSMIYTFSSVLVSYNSTKSLSNSYTVKPWLLISNSNAQIFNNYQIEEASSRVKNYIESNQVLPNYVKIENCDVTMAQFLELLTTSLIQISNGADGQMLLKSINAPLNSNGNYSSGTIYKADYINMAQRIKSFMDSNSISPNYATSTLGNIQFETLIYIYSKIMNFEFVNGYLPNYVTVAQWNQNSSTTISSDLQQYLQATANCQVNDPSIKSLASAITSSYSTTYDKAKAVYNWVRDNIGYSYYYNTCYGAVGTLNARTGNCVDTAHLLIALERAAGIPARYEHVYAQFTSGTWYGHVIAQVYVNGVWYDADGTSSKNSFGVVNNWNKNTATIYGTYAELPF
jgi:hypothetical protein